MAQSGIVAQVQALLGSGRHGEAARLLLAEAARGSREACKELANWRIAGNIVKRDLPAARALLFKAGASGDSDAALLHAALLAAGVGGADEWKPAHARLAQLAASNPRARAQVGLLDRMELTQQGLPARAAERRVLATTPEVVAFERFATSAECAYLRKKLEGSLTPSVVVDPATGRLIPHPIRSSDGAAFGVYDEDLVINAINRRIAAATGTRLDQGEPLQLLRYRPGGEYRAHLDALPPGGSQRILTLILYLSDRYEGGETCFPRIGLTFRGRTGDALMFRNVTADGRPNQLSLHAGLPVTRGEKLIATRWIRGDSFSYPPPRPLLDI